jgi:glycosyltransferase involved in cell wall biosynthesis
MRSAGRARAKLSIDVGPLLDDQWTGIPVYTRRLIRALQREAELDLDFAFDLVRLPRAHVEAAMSLGSGAFLRESFEIHARDDAELIDFAAPLLYPSNKLHRAHLRREASTVHDISTLVMPENHDEINVAHHLDHLEEELETDEAVFCISQATRAALVTSLPSVKPKARLIYQYVDWPENFRWLERNAPRVRLGRYAVVVGTVEPRKNLQLLIKALALPQLAQSDLQFVVVGKKGWLIDPFLESLTPAQRQRLVFSGFVTEFVKYRLIANAEFLVFPSMYEGFGIPALEAMSLGKPVLCARSSSFPEVVGEAGVYFDPFSASDFADALAEISAPKRLAELGPSAIRQNAKFTPDRMAAPVVEWALGR